MKGIQRRNLYEVLVWLIYVCIYKYDLLLRSAASVLPRLRMNFPFPQVILYSIATTLYVLPFYRWLGPALLRRRQFVLLSVTTLGYFIFIPKYVNWGICYLFKLWNADTVLAPFYRQEFFLYNAMAHTRGLRISEVLMDLLAFCSVLFLRWASESEEKRHALERDNLVLQLEALKAQLHPHFLFNTLNSIYGMSLMGAKETPAFILRLSEMMRYVLYDCRDNRVDLEKDIHFAGNYIEMEKKRYPQADIHFRFAGPFPGKIAPLLLIPFIENSFKHGAHRVEDNAFIRGSVEEKDGTLCFYIENSVLPAESGGVGIENVRKRLALYYPGKHALTIDAGAKIYSVDLKIQLA